MDSTEYKPIFGMCFDCKKNDSGFCGGFEENFDCPYQDEENGTCWEAYNEAQYAIMDLKPCPFCGEKAFSGTCTTGEPDYKFVGFVECSSCGAVGAKKYSHEEQLARQEAIKEWNRRICDVH